MRRPTISLKVKGFKELREKLQRMVPFDTVQKEALRNAYLKAAEVVKDKIGSRVPRKEGFLAASLKVDISPSTQPAAFAAVDRKIAWYGRLVEYGHATKGGGSVAPRPFWRPGIAAARDGVRKVLQEELRKIVISGTTKA